MIVKPFNRNTMSNEILILEKLEKLEQRIGEQNLLMKEVLNFNDACNYLDISASHLYKLTSQKSIPHFCPQGKKLYFNRAELDEWLQRNRQTSTDEIETLAANYLLTHKRK
jgi:excisionase family DNA binding protein